MKIIVAGDFCPCHRVADRFEQNDFYSVLGDIKKITHNFDYSIVNFECPITSGIESPIEKCGPNLHCGEKGIEAIKWAGFDCVTLANNHFLDYGKEGVEHTLEACKNYNIDTVGGGMNLQEASKILYKEIDGKTLAIINCCEHEFSIATETTAGSNPLNPIQQYYAIQDAKIKADNVLVIVHGGHEHYQLPSPRMQEIYRFFIDAGADAVVNHHQHCFSGHEIYKGKPIFYGLGNFCFDKPCKKNEIWNEGYMVELYFNAQQTIFFLIPYEQCNESPCIKIISDKEKEKFEETICKLNEIIADDNNLSIHINQYYEDCGNYELSILEPYSNKHLKRLHKIGVLPSFLTGKKLYSTLNHIVCESHRDKLLYALWHQI